MQKKLGQWIQHKVVIKSLITECFHLASCQIKAHFGSMADYQDEFKRILDKKVGDYAALALGLLTQARQALGLVLTEQLLHSLQTQDAAATVTHIALFEQYGRHHALAAAASAARRHGLSAGCAELSAATAAGATGAVRLLVPFLNDQRHCRRPACALAALPSTTA
jgi:hypothetical protein